MSRTKKCPHPDCDYDNDHAAGFSAHVRGHIGRLELMYGQDGQLYPTNLPLATYESDRKSRMKSINEGHLDRSSVHIRTSEDDVLDNLPVKVEEASISDESHLPFDLDSLNPAQVASLKEKLSIDKDQSDIDIDQRDSATRVTDLLKQTVVLSTLAELLDDDPAIADRMMTVLSSLKQNR